MLPVFLHSYSAVMSFGKGEFKFVVLFSRALSCSVSFVHVVCSAFSVSSKGPCWWDVNIHLVAERGPS